MAFFFKNKPLWKHAFYNYFNRSFEKSENKNSKQNRNNEILAIFVRTYYVDDPK